MARCEIVEGRIVVVTLSRRNLAALTHKLDWPGSFRTIVNRDVHRDGAHAPEMALVLRCEDDDEHYARRRAGLMHPDTEEFIARRAGSGGHGP
jgi:hypothetical protein